MKKMKMKRNANSKTRQQIAFEYKVHPNTLRRMFKKEGIDVPSGLISPKTQEMIYSRLGSPI